jgi:hypothetical protein
MRTTLAYLKYLLRHKWFVLLACWRLGVPLRRALIHDWSKFTPSEFGPYKRYFFDRKDEFKAGKLDPNKVSADFDRAWNHHQKANKHHWDYWVMPGDKISQPRPIPMPETYVAEMVADWMGAGRAKTGSWDMEEWVCQNAPNMHLHPKTAQTVRELLFGMAMFRAADAVFYHHLHRSCISGGGK